MTFEDIVSRVAKRLNLTSTEALTRIGDEVNEVYAEVVTSIGLSTSSRGTISGYTTEGSRMVTFGDDETDGVQKVETIFDPDTPGPTGILGEVSYDQMRSTIPSSVWPARQFAIYRMNAHSVEVMLDVEAPTADEELQADVLLDTITLAGGDEPMFSANYHDILIKGAMQIELFKLEKPTLSKDQEVQKERRLGDLRMFIAKSPRNVFYPNKRANGMVPRGRTRV